MNLSSQTINCTHWEWCILYGLNSLTLNWYANHLSHEEKGLDRPRVNISDDDSLWCASFLFHSCWIVVALNKQLMIWRWLFVPWRTIGWKLREQLANGNDLDAAPPMAVQFHAIQYRLPQDDGHSGGSTQQLLKRRKWMHSWPLEWGQCGFAGTPGHHWDQKQHHLKHMSSRSQSGLVIGI
jgi:hypothetical protein